MRYRVIDLGVKFHSLQLGNLRQPDNLSLTQRALYLKLHTRTKSREMSNCSLDLLIAWERKEEGVKTKEATVKGPYKVLRFNRYNFHT